MDRWLVKKRAHDSALTLTMPSADSSSPPSAKRAQPLSASASEEKDSSATANRIWQNTWLNDNRLKDWLSYDATNDTAYCSVCAEFGKASSVITPWSGSWHKRQLKQHAEVKKHKENAEKKKSKPKDFIVQSFAKSTTISEVRVLAKLRTVHFSVKMLLPQHTTTALHDHINWQLRYICTAFDVPIPPSLTSKGSHASNWSTRQFTH